MPKTTVKKSDSEAAEKEKKTTKTQAASIETTEQAKPAESKSVDSTEKIAVETAPQVASTSEVIAEPNQVTEKPSQTNNFPKQNPWPAKRVPVIPLSSRQNYGSRGNQRQNRQGQSNQGQNHNGDSNSAIGASHSGQTVKGFLDTSRDGHGVVRVGFNGTDELDAYISTAMIRRFKIRPGDVVEGPVREPKENERYWGLLQVDKVNGLPPNEAAKLDRQKFQKLTPVYPDVQMKLETSEEPLSTRIIDMIAPIGKGQRSLIVSPPKAGKTTFLKEIATGLASNHPEVHIMAVLVGERPEEVTDIKRHIERLTNGKGEVAASNFDEPAEDQCRVAELALERAKRLVEVGQDVVILLDSITRLARAYNLSIPTSGRTLSGGFDPAALFPPKRFFGAARNFEVPGSLTIIGTALVDTGSRMDDLIYEEFKGTGNQEVHLDRRLAERRIYPAIDVQRSGTRRDDLLMDAMQYQSIMTLHRMLDMLDKEERTSTLVEQLKKTKSNKEFLASLKLG